MTNLSAPSLIWTVLVFASFILSVCLHEFGHALVAYWGGDRSVKDKGYLTLNPLKYTHPTYSIVMPLIFLLLGGIPLPGAAVYINTAALRTRAWRSAVSAAGPFATLLVAVAIAMILNRMQPNYAELVQSGFSFGEISGDGLTLKDWIVQGLVLLLTLEIAGVFLNLMPVPGLDGFGMIEPWLSSSMQQQARNFSRYGILILFGAFWLVPQFNQGFWSLVYGTVESLGVPSAVSPLGFYLFRQGAQFLFFILLIGWVIIAQVKKRRSPSLSAQSEVKSDEILEQELQALNQQLILGQSASLLSQKGAVLIQLERYEDALVAIEQSLALQDNEPQSWAMKGFLCYLLHRQPEAIAAYQKAIALNPEEDDSWQGLGMAHCEAQEYGAAISAYNQALRYTSDLPTQAHILSLKSRTYFSQSRYEECLLVLDEVLQMMPNHDTALYNQACCYAQLGDLDQGIACLEQMVANGNDFLRREAQCDPDLEALRSHQKFAAIVGEN